MREGRVSDDADIKTSGPRPPVFHLPLYANPRQARFHPFPTPPSLDGRFTPSSLSSNSHLILTLRNFLFIIL